MRTKFKYLPNGRRMVWDQWIAFLIEFEAALAAQGIRAPKPEAGNVT